MPVFDFNSAPEDKKEVQCTYTTFCSNEDHATPECPILVLDNQNRKWNHHSCGVFTNIYRPQACFRPIVFLKGALTV